MKVIDVRGRSIMIYMAKKRKGLISLTENFLTVRKSVHQKMWTNVFFLETIRKHICCSFNVEVQLKLVRKDGVLRYTAWTKKSGWDTKKNNALKYWHMLHLWDPLIPSYRHIPKGSKIVPISTPVSRWGANWNIGSLFVFWSKSKKGCQSLYIMPIFENFQANVQLTSPTETGVTTVAKGSKVTAP